MHFRPRVIPIIDQMAWSKWSLLYSWVLVITEIIAGIHRMSPPKNKDREALDLLEDLEVYCSLVGKPKLFPSYHEHSQQDSKTPTLEQLTSTMTW